MQADKIEMEIRQFTPHVGPLWHIL